MRKCHQNAIARTVAEQNKKSVSSLENRFRTAVDETQLELFPLEKKRSSGWMLLLLFAMLVLATACFAGEKQELWFSRGLICTTEEQVEQFLAEESLKPLQPNLQLVTEGCTVTEQGFPTMVEPIKTYNDGSVKAVIIEMDTPFGRRYNYISFEVIDGNNI